MRRPRLVRSRRTAGLDVGTRVLKLVVVDHARDEPRLEAAVTRTLPASATTEGEVVDPTLVGDGIRELAGRAGIGSEQLVISVGGRDVIVKLIRMDRMERTDVREVIGWEAGQHVPFAMEDVQIDFQITDPGAGGRQMTVLLVAAKRELVERRLSLVKEAGLTPSVVDVDAFGLCNALEYNYPEAMDGTGALVSIGHDATSVVLLEDGVPVLTRDLTVGMRRLALELQRQEGLTPLRARRALRGADETPAMASFVAERAAEIARGVERAASFLETRRIGERLGRVYLCGGGVVVPGLADALAERLEVETHVTSPIRYLPVRPDALADGEIEHAAPLLTLATGLALRPPA